MPPILANIPHQVLDRIRQLIDFGKYPDISTFLMIAAENQLALEGLEEQETGKLLRISPKDIGAGSPSARSELKQDRIPASLPVLEPFSRDGKLSLWEQWPWGQMNKILPIKFVVRSLAVALSQAEPLIPFELFKEETAETARMFGEWLHSLDRKYERPRGERFAAAFPTGEAAENSKWRFANQFIGQQRKRDGMLFGALFEFMFGNLERVGKVDSVGLTAAGLEFAKLPNPILDEIDFMRSLSEQEIEFYLRHIRESVPGEVFAFRTILELIESGVNDREEINKGIRKVVKGEWSDAMVNTQRAGAMARMFELGLIGKTKNGVNVTYHVTDLGKQWLARL